MADDEAADLSGDEVAAAGAGGGGGQAAGYSHAGSSCEPSGCGLAECDSAGEDEPPLEAFELDEQESMDTTAQQRERDGRDLQGIPWERLQVTRERYRLQRLQQYRNYMNCIPEDEWPAVHAEMLAGWPQPSRLPACSWPYAFVRNWRAVCSSIVHFQLRNLLWAASAHDAYVVYDNRVQHWSSVTRAVGDVLDLRGTPKGPRLPGLGRVQVSTLCVSGDLLAAGGFGGELVLASLARGGSDEEGEEGDEGMQDGCASDGDTEGLLWGGRCDWEQQLASPHRQQQQQLFGWVRQGQPTGAWQEQQHHWQLRQRQMWQACTGAVEQPGAPRPRQHGQQQQQQQRCRQRQRRRRADQGVLGAAGPAAAEVLHCCRVTQSENGITNGIELFDSCTLGRGVMAANNDCCVRLFDVEGCRPRQRLAFPFAVNFATMRPDGASLGGGPVAAVVGDDPVTWLVDCRSGIEVMKLQGHRDFSFAAAWHPAGHLLATGNQDSTTRVWDVRHAATPVAVLGGTMGAVRSLRFSPDGAHLAAAEPADFVRVYDVAGGFSASQEIDLFGEVAGISFSPDAASLFVAISDTLYSSLLQYQRVAPRGPRP